MIPPGQTIGILGGGQLGRMSILAGRRMGYRFGVYEAGGGTTAGRVADWQINADYDDLDSLATFAKRVQVATVEFENISAAALNTLAENIPVRPAPNVLHVCQNRLREKNFLRKHGFPHAAFREIRSVDDLRAGLAEIGTPAVLKTADFGYDGKGQLKIEREADDPAAIWARFAAPRAVLEAWVPFQAEASVVVARTADGTSSTFPLTENIHHNHILHASIAPGRFSRKTTAEAEDLARALAGQLDCVGLLAVELFVLGDGTLRVNELAPRPHNSGHHTLESCQTSQFEQHIRTVCGLVPGNPRLLRPAVMINLLGDLWHQGRSPDWSPLLRDVDTYLHLYDKGAARPGRKMGHFTVLRDTREEALQAAESAFAQLT